MTTTTSAAAVRSRSPPCRRVPAPLPLQLLLLLLLLLLVAFGCLSALPTDAYSDLGCIVAASGSSVLNNPTESLEKSDVPALNCCNAYPFVLMQQDCSSADGSCYWTCVCLQSKPSGTILYPPTCGADMTCSGNHLYHCGHISSKSWEVFQHDVAVATTSSTTANPPQTQTSAAAPATTANSGGDGGSNGGGGGGSSSSGGSSAGSDSGSGGGGGSGSGDTAGSSSIVVVSSGVTITIAAPQTTIAGAPANGFSTVGPVTSSSTTGVTAGSSGGGTVASDGTSSKVPGLFIGVGAALAVCLIIAFVAAVVVFKRKREKQQVAPKMAIIGNGGVFRGNNDSPFESGGRRPILKPTHAADPYSAAIAAAERSWPPPIQSMSPIVPPGATFHGAEPVRSRSASASTSGVSQSTPSTFSLTPSPDFRSSSVSPLREPITTVSFIDSKPAYHQSAGGPVEADDYKLMEKTRFAPASVQPLPGAISMLSELPAYRPPDHSVSDAKGPISPLAQSSRQEPLPSAPTGYPTRESSTSTAAAAPSFVPAGRIPFTPRERGGYPAIVQGGAARAMAADRDTESQIDSPATQYRKFGNKLARDVSVREVGIFSPYDDESIEEPYNDAQ